MGGSAEGFKLGTRLHEIAAYGASGLVFDVATFGVALDLVCHNIWAGPIGRQGHFVAPRFQFSFVASDFVVVCSGPICCIRAALGGRKRLGWCSECGGRLGRTDRSGGRLKLGRAAGRDATSFGVEYDIDVLVLCKHVSGNDGPGC
jgi:hypothetical protein